MRPAVQGRARDPERRDRADIRRARRARRAFRRCDGGHPPGRSEDASPVVRHALTGSVHRVIPSRRPGTGSRPRADDLADGPQVRRAGWIAARILGDGGLRRLRRVIPAEPAGAPVRRSDGRRRASPQCAGRARRPDAGFTPAELIGAGSPRTDGGHALGRITWVDRPRCRAAHTSRDGACPRRPRRGLPKWRGAPGPNPAVPGRSADSNRVKSDRDERLSRWLPWVTGAILAVFYAAV